MRRYNRLTKMNEGAFFKDIKKRLTINFEDGIELSNKDLVCYLNSLFSSGLIEMSILLNGKEVSYSTLKDFKYRYEHNVIEIEHQGNLTVLGINGIDVRKVSVMVNPNDNEYTKMLRDGDDGVVNFNTAEIQYIEILYKDTDVIIRLKNNRGLGFLRN